LLRTHIVTTGFGVGRIADGVANPWTVGAGAEPEDDKWAIAKTALNKPIAVEELDDEAADAADAAAKAAAEAAEEAAKAVEDAAMDGPLPTTSSTAITTAVTAHYCLTACSSSSLCHVAYTGAAAVSVVV
jgi:hypothetical protein